MLFRSDVLMASGVPAERVCVETASRTTAEQAANVAAMLKALDLAGPVVVVTTTAHMPRIVQCLEAYGIACLPSGTPELRYDGRGRGWRRWWPSMAALTGSASAMYEHMALVRDGVRRA